ncbi:MULTISPECIES: DUF3558 domain-containing protein [Streptomyces]|uniref:DUF3558 domain-containing protein n=2 Tax=Streptomyces TaxID=1883 RepID=A0A2U9P6B7_STRAS|nr:MULTISPECIES: DUF3558 domain-containing protein [Streptomyces]AWT44744.1 hypothetical protein DMT42_22260 [Streptomyces actuosus]MBM4821285.1 DUF3558 domain-containing protein [Streptomyces actuosus]GHF87203.1 hypothetical protein GCM10018783_67290 [Streptomyces griseosporeus]
MQRKAYVTSATAALLAALLAGCTGGSGKGGGTDNSNPGEPDAHSAQAQPGKYRTLPEPCGAVRPATLDALLPGLPQIIDEKQREKAYEGTAILTYDTDRKVGCRWKADSIAGVDHLYVDFERVVSYDSSVSDDSQAEQIFATQVAAADLPEPTASAPASPSGSESSTSATPSPSASRSGSASPTTTGSASPSSSTSPSPSSTEELQPRLLDGLGDEAFLDDQLTGSGSTSRQRKVTVAFRTSNVIVTIEYEEQPTTVGAEPDSKEMQDNARKLAAQLADSLPG